MKKILFASILSVIAFSANAETTRYIGDWATVWTNSASWSNGVPTATVDAVMDLYNDFEKTKLVTKGYGSTLINTQTTTLKSLTIENLYVDNGSGGYKAANLELRAQNNSSSAKLFEVLGDVNFNRSIGGGNVIFGKVEGNLGDANRIPMIISIGGNLNLGNRAQEVFSDTSHGYTGSFSFGNGVATEFTGWNGGPQKLTIAGNIDLYGRDGARLSMDVGTLNRTFGDISNPDVVIGGTVSMEASSKYSYPTWCINARTDAYALNTVIQLGGLGHASNMDKQNGNVRVEKATAGTNTATMVFTNAEGTTTTFIGLLADTIVNSTSGTISNTGKIKIVMDGLGTQILRASYLPDCHFITGGVMVKNGTLLLYSTDVNALVTDRTLVPFGDVELQGGRIGAIGKGGEKIGSLWAANLFWAGNGKILVDLNATSCDLIHFKGGVYKDTSIAGAGNIYAFEFVSLADVTDGIQYKIVTFDGSTDFTASDFSSNAESLGKSATFSMDANNIYVMFNTIPEPATCALLLGAAVLVLAIRRQRVRG